MKNRIISFTFLTCFVSLLIGNTSYALRWDFADSSSISGWVARPNTTLSWQPNGGLGNLWINTSGGDPGVMSNSVSINASTDKKVRFSMSSYCQSSTVELFFKPSSSSTFVSGGRQSAVYGNSWTTYTFDLRANSSWAGTISQLRIDPSDNCGTSSSPTLVAIDWLETVSNRPPVISSFSVSPSPLSNGWTLYGNVSSSEPDNDSYSCQYQVNGGTWQNAGTTNGQFTISGLTVGNNKDGTNNTIGFKCTDAYGAYGTWSSPPVVKDYAVPSTTPASLSPSGGTLAYQSSGYQFTFGASYDSLNVAAHHYQLTIADNSSYNNPIYNGEVAGSPAPTTPVALSSGKMYYWKICGENALGTSGPCGSASFRINGPPVISAFSVSPSPLSNGWTLNGNVTSSEPDNDSYSCQYQVNGGTWQNAGKTNGQFSISGLSVGNNRVGTSNTIGFKCTDTYGAYGAWSSPPVVMDYAVPSTTPTGLSPNGVALASQSGYQFTFGAAYDSFNVAAHHYQLTIADNLSYSNPLYDSEIAGSPSPSITLPPGKTYYWKICGENALATSGPCATATFSVNAPTLTPPELLKPLSGETLTPLPNGKVGLRWKDVPGGTIRLYIDSLPPMDMRSGQTVFDAALFEGAHSWKACTLNAELQCGALTGEMNFTIQVAPMGFLARTVDNPDVYWIMLGKKWKVNDAATFFGLGYADADIQWHESGALDSLIPGENIVSTNGLFCYRSQSSNSIYKIQDGKSLPFFNWESFLAQGFTEKDIYWATQAGFDWIQSVYPMHNGPKIRVEPKSINFQ